MRYTIGQIEKVRARYRDKVHFYLVYTEEAHPDLGGAACFSAQKSMRERKEAAWALVGFAGLSLPVLLDTMDRKTTSTYGAIPSRYYIIDANGRIAYQISATMSSAWEHSIPQVLDDLLKAGG